ncbi:MAG: ribonuclease HIII [Armatimonadetes bacterium]|nr:ribonuclease HIII [Armatimonadota bacterium]
MDGGHIGVDESGKGDFFGPLVVAGCYVSPEMERDLPDVQDCKKISDAKIHAVAEQIKRTCPNTVLVVMPKRYNEIYSDLKNLNTLLEWGHAKVIEEVLKLQPAKLAISDQFAKPAGLREKLKRKGLDIVLRSEVRAESDIAVAAASVLARAEFLNRLAELSDEFGIKLPKGATNVIGTGKQFVRDFGPDKLGEIAKLHFKTTRQVLNS